MAERVEVRLKSLLDFIPKNMRKWQVIESLSKCYDNIIASGTTSSSSVTSLGPLLHMSQLLTDEIEQSDIGDYTSDLFSFYLEALRFREKFADELTLAEIDYVETKAVDALIALMLKQNESQYSIRFKMLLDWASEDSYLFSRRCAFYHCVSKLSSTIQQFFSKSATLLLENLTSTLTISLTSTKKGSSDEEKFLALGYAIDTLSTSLKHCGKQLNVDAVVEPLVNQLEILSSGDQSLAADYVSRHLIPCLGEVAISVDDWQMLNRDVLNKARHESDVVRLRVPSAVLGLVERLGEEYHGAMYDMIQCFQELREDYNSEVIEHCDATIVKMVPILGEELRQEFLDLE